MTDRQNHWQAVALSGHVRQKPKRILFESEPVVLFRSNGQIAALVDRCPHRLAELSTGRLRDGEIECPYHGWRFDREGLCKAIPGHIGALPHLRVRRFRATECDGVVFLSGGDPYGAPYLHAIEGKDVFVHRVRSSTRSTVLDVAENILDATHTHFTHKGLLRGLGSKRQRVKVAVTGGDGWVEACYTGEARQQGFVSKVLEGARSRTIGRFRFPGIAELEYWGQNGLNLATTFHLRQADEETVEGIGLLIGPRKGGLEYAMALAFKPLFTLALHQDRRVLQSGRENARMAPEARPAIGPLDFLRNDIAAILAGDSPKASSEPDYYEMEL